MGSWDHGLMGSWASVDVGARETRLPNYDAYAAANVAANAAANGAPGVSRAVMQTKTAVRQPRWRAFFKMRVVTC